MNRPGYSLMHLLRAVLLVLIGVAAAWPAAAQQPTTTRYIYDENGRLRAVIAPTGEAAVYDYDPAGNITAIRRLNAASFELLTFFPDVGKAGDLVTFRGLGLDTVTAVAFNGAAARIVRAEPTRVIAEVPTAAMTGPITLTSPRGTLTTTLPFIVRGVVVAPRMVSLNLGQQHQFTVRVLPEGSDQAVTWSVNGVSGGNSTFGTITATGAYTAPRTLFSMITVRATSVADPDLTDEALVMVGIIDPTPTVAAISAVVSVGRDQSPPPLTLVAAISASVAVAREQSDPPTTPTAAVAAAVSASKGALIATTAPAAVVRGASNVTLTISGTNLHGASVIRFINAAGAADANLMATNLSVSADGRTLTVTLSVNAAAAPGRRLVIVTTPGGHSQVYQNGSSAGQNTIEVTP